MLSRVAGTKNTRSGMGPPDSVLVTCARAGEPWAREALFRRYAVMVNGLVFRLIRRDTDLDDIVQEIFAQALTSLAKLKDPEAFSTWLGGIAVRTVHKALRRRRMLERLGLRRPEPLDADALVSSSASPEMAAELKALYRVVDAMPAGVRLVLLLHRAEGMTLAEVSETSGFSLTTVKRRLATAEQLLAHKSVPWRSQP